MFDYIENLCTWIGLIGGGVSIIALICISVGLESDSFIPHKYIPSSKYCTTYSNTRVKQQTNTYTSPRSNDIIVPSAINIIQQPTKPITQSSTPAPVTPTNISTDINGNTTLIQSCRYKNSDAALSLIATGNSKPEHVNRFGITALIWACRNKMTDVALALIDTGESNPEQVTNGGDTALLLACNNAMTNVALALIDTKNSNYKQVDNDGNTALTYAIQNNITDVIHVLLNYDLIDACRINDIDSALNILQSNKLINIDGSNDEGHTALMWACHHIMYPVAIAILDHPSITYKYVERVNDDNYTAIRIATRNNMHTIVDRIVALQYRNKST